MYHHDLGTQVCHIGLPLRSIIHAHSGNMHVARLDEGSVAGAVPRAPVRCASAYRHIIGLLTTTSTSVNMI